MRRGGFCSNIKPVPLKRCWVCSCLLEKDGDFSDGFPRDLSGGLCEVDGQRSGKGSCG